MQEVSELLLQPTKIVVSKNYSLIGRQYAQDVINKKIVACKWVDLACRRSEQHHYRSINYQDYTYEFRPDLADRICRFAECFNHIEGDKGGTKLELFPWQVWFLTNLFGWVLKGTKTRKYRVAHMEVAKGNGKSFLSSIIILYMLGADGEHGPQVVCAATKTSQAQIVFGIAQKMALNHPQLMARLGIEVKAHQIICTKNFGRCGALSREAKKHDGLNLHYACVDELHAHPDRVMWDNLCSGSRKRSRSLVMSITTAGYNLSGIGKEQNNYTRKVLEGAISDEVFWGAIWTIDEKDDWKEESNWIKANPCWDGGVIDQISFRSDALAAQAIPSKQVGFLTKQLNVWCSSMTSWADVPMWKAAQDPKLKLSDFDIDEESNRAQCWIGVDLASKIDITAVSLVFPSEEGGKRHYYCFVKYYLPEDAIKKGLNSQYKGWAQAGYIKETQGNVLDYDVVKADILSYCKRFDVQEIAFDPYGALEMQNDLAKHRLPIVNVGQGLLSISEPSKLLDSLVRSGCFHIPVDPVLIWMASNVIVYIDTSDNIKPRKDKPEDKIDGIIATIIALARALIQEKKTSIYESREGITFI
jgi:phage terminase large subunit-like protein